MTGNYSQWCHSVKGSLLAPLLFCAAPSVRPAFDGRFFRALVKRCWRFVTVFRQKLNMNELRERDGKEKEKMWWWETTARDTQRGRDFKKLLSKALGNCIRHNNAVIYSSHLCLHSQNITSTASRPARRLRCGDEILSDRRVKNGCKAMHHFWRERKPSCFMNTNTSRRFLKVCSISFWIFFFFVTVTASHFPIGHQIVAHRFHKEQREFTKRGGARLPWVLIKTSFGKVAAFYPLPSCFLFFSSFFATFLNKLQ